MQRLNIKRFLERYPANDPFTSCIWGDFVLRPAVIKKRLADNKLIDTPVPMYTYTRGVERSRHEGRVAWLMANGWDDPIWVDLGVWEERELNIDDGFHRFAAAMLLGHETIAAIISGLVARIVEVEQPR